MKITLAFLLGLSLGVSIFYWGIVEGARLKADSRVTMFVNSEYMPSPSGNLLNIQKSKKRGIK